MKKKLKASTVYVKTLTQNDTERMLSLFGQYYENIDKNKFYSDLKNKDRVIILRDIETQTIQGFSTLKDMEIQQNNKKIRALFSGDTIIDRDYWGQTALTMEFFKVVAMAKLKNPLEPYYWMLISKGFKTYLLLANNFMTYWPRFDQKTPSDAQEIMNLLGHSLFPGEYIEESGLIVFKKPADRLKLDTAPIDEKLILKNPKIKFFQDKNPGWQKGDELVCIGSVDLGLATKYLSRTFLKFLR
jgi:hypothetical protein